jgi:ABC-type phosphate transport system substrate-binding protein
MRKILISAIAVCLLSLVWQPAARADIAVIVHPDNPVLSMTPREVSNLYLGRARSFSTDGRTAPLSASVYELPSDCALRETFFRTLNGMDIKQLNAYWARLRFSGEVLPPATLPDSRAVVETVSHKRSAIGYVDAAAVNNAVKVVLRLKE